MTFPAPRLILSIALTLAAAPTLCAQGPVDPLPGLDFNGPQTERPERAPTGPLFEDPSPLLPESEPPAPQGEPEELVAPGLPNDDADSPSDDEAANDPTEEEASRLVEYNAVQNPWLPVRDDEPVGWLEELAVPPGCLDCTCHGKTPGEACRVWRSFQKPTHPAIDQDCVVCVKEPVLGYVKEHYTTDAVVQKCFVTEKCFTDKECADGRCIETRGTKTVKQLYPCKAKVKLFYWKPVVEYRDVYYYINCEPCNEADQQVALKAADEKAAR